MPAATQKVDMLIGVTAQASGKGVESLIAQREILNADEFSLFYSTDFPFGGTEPVGGYDINNNEILETVTIDPRNVRHRLLLRDSRVRRHDRDQLRSRPSRLPGTSTPTTAGS